MFIKKLNRLKKPIFLAAAIMSGMVYTITAVAVDPYSPGIQEPVLSAITGVEIRYPHTDETSGGVLNNLVGNVLQENAEGALSAMGRTINRDESPNDDMEDALKDMSSAAKDGDKSDMLAAGNHVGEHGTETSSSNVDHWVAPATEAARTNPIRITVGSIARGERTYQKNCSSCHGVGADGNGMGGMMLNPKPADLRAMSGFHPDGDFAYKIREGRGAMPAWKNVLGDSQVWNLVNYIQTMDRHPETNQESDHTHESGHGDLLANPG